MAHRAKERMVDLENRLALQFGEVLVQLDQVPLVHMIDRLGDPAQILDERELVNLAAKYFFAYVHPGAQENPVPADEIGRLLAMHARSKSLNEPDDDIEVMNTLRMFGPGLGLVSDAVRAGMILLEMMSQDPAPGQRFLGLDIHTGAGLLVLGQYLMGRRLGRKTIEVWGMDHDQATAERSGALLRSLGVGNVISADPADAASYDILGGRPVSMISTPMVAGETAHLSEERFFGSYAALFEALGKSVDASVFFPEGLIAYSRDMNASLIFSKDNGYQRPPEYAESTFHPQGLLIDGRVLPLHRLAGGLRTIIR